MTFSLDRTKTTPKRTHISIDDIKTAYRLRLSKNTNLEEKEEIPSFKPSDSAKFLGFDKLIGFKEEKKQLIHLLIILKTKKIMKVLVM